MKPTRDTAYLTIATSIISALMVLIIHFSQGLSLTVSLAIRAVFSFIPMICFAWLMIFIISILKYTQEKTFIVNVFIIYLAYNILQNLVNFSIGFLGISPDQILLYYQANGFINLLAVILLVVMTFALRETGFRLSLRVFALSELFIMGFYMLIPPLLNFLGITNYNDYYKYIGFVYLVIPASGLYIAVTALNIINNQQQPFYPTNKPDWPPYDKPGM